MISGLWSHPISVPSSDPKGRSGLEIERLFIVLAVAFLITVLIRTAWIADDAGIELRVVENFVTGNGLRWNVAERVQAYSDPLWVLLLSAIDFFERQPYLSAWVVSLVLTTVAALAIAFRLAADAAGMMAIALLIFSKAFVEYSVSGFQTPLTVMLLVAFWIAYWKRRPEAGRLTALAFLAGLLVLTDPLAVVLVLPGLVVAAARVDRRTRVRAIAVGAAPAAAWLVFAAVYYGFLLPNTATAALHSRASPGEMLLQGSYYLLDGLNSDPVAVATIAGALTAAAFGMIDDCGPLAIGILTFVPVLVATGGDALSGRSLVPPFASAVILLTRYRWRQLGDFLAIPAAVVVALGLTAPASPVLADADFGKDVAAWNRWPGDPAPKPTEANHIRDERRLSYQVTGLLKGQRYVPLPDTSAAEATVNTALATRGHVVVDETVGLLGVVAGPRLHVIDRLARGDALLARLRPRDRWRPGGAPRELPRGYLQSRESASNVIDDPAIARYFDALSIVTSGPLFSQDRIRAMVDVNLGRPAR